MSLSLKVSGIRELKGLMKELPKRVQNRVGSKAVRAGGAVVRKAIRGAVPGFTPFELGFGKKGVIGPKDLKKEITNQVRKGRNGDKYAVIGAKHGFPWHWLEYGTLAKRMKPLDKGRSPGAVAATAKGLGKAKKPFARAAFSGSKTAALRAVAEKIVSEIPKEVGKLVR